MIRLDFLKLNESYLKKKGGIAKLITVKGEQLPYIFEGH